MIKKNLLHLFCLVFLLILGRAVVLYLIEPVDYSIYFNHILRNKTAANNGQLDMVFIGASRTLRTFDPDVFENVLGLDCVFNAASGLQPIESSYYMLKELIERYHPKYAVLGVTWEGLLGSDSTLAKVIVLDRLHGKNKQDYLTNAFSSDEYPDALSLCYRFRNNFTAEKIKKNLQEKTELRKNGWSQRQSPPDLYTDNGFIYSYQVGDIPNYAEVQYDPAGIDPKKAGALEMIAELCSENGIRLFLVSAPTTMMSLYRINGYQNAVDYYSKFAADHGIDYVNLNYLKDREAWLGDGLMFDFNHVNGEGAELVSEKYGEYLKAVLSGGEIPDMFYSDLAELQESVHRIIAVGANISITDRMASIRISSRQTQGITPLYRIQISQDDETFIPLTDWTEETEFVFDVSAYHGTAHFLVEAMSTTGEPGCTIRYHIPV